MKKPLGRLKAVELREAWTDEARDFTPWLAQPENLNALSEAIEDVELELEGTEVPVGTYKCDIVATDGFTKGRVVIENQLDKTDHKHLGQIITYASGLNAKTIIWIAREIVDEHRQAIDFLNEQAAPDLRLYCVELKLFKIGDSPMAPDFRVVARPNVFLERVKSDKQGLSKTQTLYRDFWTAFKEYCEEAGSTLRIGAPPAQNWFALAVGRSGFMLSLTATNAHNRIGCEIYVSGGMAKRAFKLLEKDKLAIEKTLGALEWQELPDKTDVRIVQYRPKIEIENRSTWPVSFEWLRERAESFSAVFSPRIKQLNLKD